MRWLSAFVCLKAFAVAGWAAPAESLLVAAAAEGVFTLVGKTAAPIAVAANDWPGVRRAAGDLQVDITRMSLV